MERRPNLSEKGLYNILSKDLKTKIANLKYRKEISRIHLFHDLDNSFVTELMISSRPYRVRTGDVIYSMNDIAKEITFVLNGSIKIIAKERNKETTSGFCTSGGYFGDFEYIKPGPRIADYIAVQNCTLLSIPYTVLTSAIKDNREAGLFFLKELQHRYDLFQDQEAKNLILNTALSSKRVENGHLRRNLIKYVIVILFEEYNDYSDNFYSIIIIYQNKINSTFPLSVFISVFSNHFFT